jgi:hypothetical protein
MTNKEKSTKSPTIEEIDENNENATDPQLEEKKQQQQNSITYIGKLLISCVERGGFSMQEVIKINTTIEGFKTPNTTDEQKKIMLTDIFNYIQAAQSNGKLSLEEAHNSYMCLTSFIQKPQQQVNNAIKTI